MATCDRRREEKKQQEEAAKASFNRLDEKEKNMWKYDVRKLLIRLGDAEPTDYEIELMASDARYEYSKSKRKGFFGIPKKEKVKYDKMDDNEKAHLEHEVRQMLINDGENPDMYPVDIMAVELWYGKKYGEGQMN